MSELLDLGSGIGGYFARAASVDHTTDQRTKATAPVLHFQPGGVGYCGFVELEHFGESEGGRTLQG